MSGVLTYLVRDGRDSFRCIKLTVCSEEDSKVAGLAEKRRRRISRMLEEAFRQSASLSSRDLEIILLTSRSTIKRDMKHIREMAVKSSGLSGLAQGIVS